MLQFVNATSGKVLTEINPHDESIICDVESASKEVGTGRNVIKNDLLIFLA